MTNVIDPAIIIIRLLMCAIMLQFFWHQWQLRGQNGMIRKVRNMTTWFAVAFFVQNLYQIVQRFVMNHGLTSKVGRLDWVALSTSLFLLSSITYGIWLVKKVNRATLIEEEQQKHT